MWEDILTILLIAISLSFDSFAVSVSFGLSKDKISVVSALRLAIVFSLLQGIMPLLGWIFGKTTYGFVKHIDHWIAFVLLAFVGGRMIWDALILKEKKKETIDFTKWSVLIFLGFSTSLDALAVGFNFTVMHISAYISSVFIALITFMASMLGVYIGKRSACKWGKRMEVLGGAILIAIGLKILYEHLSLKI